MKILFQRHPQSENALIRSYCSLAVNYKEANKNVDQQSTYGFTRRKSDSWDENDLATLCPHLRPDYSETLDLILRQKIYLLQSRKGYRANTDSHILAYYAWDALNRSACNEKLKPLRVLDIGAGNGMVSILFSKAHATSNLQMLELQGQLASRARRNLELNDLQGTVTRHDLANGKLPPGMEHAFDVVLLNPPFYPAKDGPPPRHREKFLAHMETSASLFDFLQAARRACDMTNPLAFVAIIHDRRELQRILDCTQKCNLDIQEVREIVHHEGEEPMRVLLKLRPNGSEVCHSIENEQTRYGNSTRKLSKLEFVEPPIALHQGPGISTRYSDEIESFLDILPLPTRRIGRLKETIE